MSLILIAPFILFIIDRINNREIVYPIPAIFIYVGFLVFSSISVIQSVNIQQSIEFLLYYTAIGLWFLYVLNHRQEIGAKLTIFVYIFSGIYLFIWIIMTLFSTFLPGALLTQTGYQFVFSKFTSHNHLGDFLILPLMGGLYYLHRHKSRMITGVIAILLVVVVVSYSRSAYLSLSIVTVLMCITFFKEKKKVSLRYIALLGILVTVLGFFFIATVTESKKIPFFQNVHEILSTDIHLDEKFFLARRTEYLQQIFLQNGFLYITGVGLGNFYFISTKEAQNVQAMTATSHNIFLDFIVENGIFATCLFILFLYYCFKHIDRKNIYFFFIIGMLLNFQTDYTYRIYSFFLLFFLFLGVAYKKEKTCVYESLPIVLLSLVLFMAVVHQYMSFGFLHQKKYSFALLLNPFQKAAYLPLIEEKKITDKEKRLLLLYERFFSGDAIVLAQIGDLYEKAGERKKAIPYYQRSFVLDKFRDDTLVYKIYIFLLLEYGQTKADAYYYMVLKDHFPSLVKKTLPYRYRKNLYELCLHTVEKRNCKEMKSI